MEIAMKRRTLLAAAPLLMAGPALAQAKPKTLRVVM
jgi:hypothetical protein